MSDQEAPTPLGQWPELDTLHLRAILFAYEKGFSAGLHERNMENVFARTGSQAAAFEAGKVKGAQHRLQENGDGRR